MRAGGVRVGAGSDCGGCEELVGGQGRTLLALLGAAPREGKVELKRRSTLLGSGRRRGRKHETVARQSELPRPCDAGAPRDKSEIDKSGTDNAAGTGETNLGWGSLCDTGSRSWTIRHGRAGRVHCCAVHSNGKRLMEAHDRAIPAAACPRRRRQALRGRHRGPVARPPRAFRARNCPAAPGITHVVTSTNSHSLASGPGPECPGEPLPAGRICCLVHCPTRGTHNVLPSIRGLPEKEISAEDASYR